MTGKVVIVGDGNVGSALSYGLFSKGVCRSLAIIDINKNKVQGDVYDLLHGQIYSQGTDVKVGDYDDMKDADIVVLIASISGKGITDRNQLLLGNLKLYHTILSSMIGKLNKKAKIIVVANPCDSLALYVKDYLGWPSDQVMASGCTLGSARLCYRLAQHFNVSSKDVNAYVVGEHGNSEVSLISSATIGNTPIRSFEGFDSIDEEKLEKDVAMDGFLVNNLKGCTDYGVALSTIEIISSILEDRGEILSVSNSNDVDGKEIYLSVPAIVSKEGIKGRIPLNFSKRELEKFIASQKVLLAKREDVVLALKEYGRIS